MTVPHNPQQNGVAERKNKRIVGATRAMLHDHGLPLYLDLFGRKPYVSHFYILRSMVYCHVSEGSKKKLEPIAERGIFTGYIETLHIYWVYMSSLRMTVMRRDVIFDEEKAMRRSPEQEFVIPPEEELLVPNEEPQSDPQDVVEQPRGGVESKMSGGTHAH